MKLFRSLALATLLAAPALAGDLVVKKEKHSDAMKMPGMEQPASDTTEVLWIGAGRMRSEEGDKVTIVRADLKKLYMIDMTAKTYTPIDLPFDMKKYVPAEVAPMMEQMMGKMKVTVTPGTETQKIQDWNTTKYVVTTSTGMGGSTQEMWVTKDVTLDVAAFHELSGAMMATSTFGAGMTEEMKKIDGFPVLTTRTQMMMGSEVKSSEKVVSIETKEPPAGHYELPAGFTEKPFDPMSGMGGPGHARGGRAPR